MATPQISVIVPVYNGAEFLGNSLQAILDQTFKDFELLILDDGSKDDSARIVRSFQDPRIRYIYQENQGLCNALNTAIHEAAAPIIARNDQDDLSLPIRLERQLAVSKKDPDAIALFCQYTKFGKKRGWTNVDKQGTADGLAQEVDPIRDGCLLGSTMMARTEFLRAVNGYRQSCYPCDDYDLEMRLCQKGKVLLLRETLVRYRFHTSAGTYRTFDIMQNKSRWVEDCYARRREGKEELTFENFLQTRKASAREQLIERRLDRAKLHMRVAGQRYLDGRDVLALWHLIASFALDPTTILRRFKRFLHPSA